ncbi:hypothetical protein MAR_005904 [Mya arenaria]|uniref:Endonuclease/exonuclease/phosphatase domain-containing protein n=1 Tax=Mya arenaria TaxID=6604 RepID=A0ABY7DBI9_MYAAR|nr:hypothetical protein MAR_005904 [Mya arenaria]
MLIEDPYFWPAAYPAVHGCLMVALETVKQTMITQFRSDSGQSNYGSQSGYDNDEYYYPSTILDSELSIFGSRPRFYVPKEGGIRGSYFSLEKDINHIISPLELYSERINGIQIMTAPDAHIFVIQVYVPCKNHSMSVYNGYLEELENNECKYNDKGTLIILGDFNTELPSAQY